MDRLDRVERKIMTLPNLLTMLRLLSAPFIIWLVMAKRWEWALSFIMIASLTDSADGYLARRLQQKTTLGAFLDPIADKALFMSLPLMLAILGLFPWGVAWLIIGRDIFILAGVLVLVIANRPLEMSPLRVSKLHTCALAVLMTWVIAEQAFVWDVPMLKQMLVSLVVFLSIFSSCGYLFVVAKALMPNRLKKEHFG